MERFLAQSGPLTRWAETWIEQTETQLNSANLIELLCALTLPLLAIVIGIRLNAIIDKKEKQTLQYRLIDFTAQLLAPLLAVAFIGIAMLVFRSSAEEMHILPFMMKLCVAWLAIHAVIIMSSRQTAGWFIALVILPITVMHLLGVWEPVVETLEGIKFSFGKVKLNLYTGLKAVAWVIGLFWVAGFIVALTDGRLRRMRSLNASNRVLMMKFFQILLYFVVIMIGMQIMGVDLTAFSVLGGAIGVGIGLGLQKIASNFISGIILLFEKSIQVDDLIELSDGTLGFIRKNAARYTAMETYDGREIMIPNEQFINEQVITHTHSTRRGRVMIPVGISYKADVQAACDLVVEIMKKHPRIIDDPAPACYAVNFGESGIDLNAFFWVEDVLEGRIGPKHDVIVAIHKGFAEHGIEIPYPHQVQVNDPAFEERIRKLEAHLDKPKSTRKPKASKA